MAKLDDGGAGAAFYTIQSPSDRLVRGRQRIDKERDLERSEALDLHQGGPVRPSRVYEMGPRIPCDTRDYEWSQHHEDATGP